MPPAGVTTRHPVAARIIRDWRRLTGGAPSVLACSGGADSTALVLSLGALPEAPDLFTVGIGLHDFRPRADVEREAAAVERIAADLKLRCVRFDVNASDLSGNDEANARRLRYEALCTIARDRGAAFVATGHHADDQLETMLLRLARGAGPKGLAGMRHIRTLGEGVRLVRPMLGVTRVDAEALCADAGIEPFEDPTNRDTSKRRAALRARVLPALIETFPKIRERAGDAADVLAGAASVLSDQALRVLGDADVEGETYAWTRAALRAERPVVIAEAVRAWHRRHAPDAKTPPARSLMSAAAAVHDAETDPRSFRVGAAGLEVRAGAVTLGPAAR